MRAIIPVPLFGLALIVLGGCGGEAVESGLPDLIHPPGEMVAQRLVLVRLVDEKGEGQDIGSIGLANSREGMKIIVDLKGLPPGDHGFHVHNEGNCGPLNVDGVMVAAGQAGGHFDPEETRSHQGPSGGGHRGDLPNLKVSAGGTVRDTLYAPRLTVREIVGRSLIIHAGADNYTDNPPSGGSGARIACGIVP